MNFNNIRMSCLRQLCTNYHKRYSTASEVLNITKNSTEKGNIRGSYFDAEENLTVPFRFCQAESHNKPLIVYFGGSGTVGCDNLANSIEFLAYAGGRDILHSDVNILVPQMIILDRNEFDNIDGYVSSCCHLITALSTRYSFDTKNIRIYGTSLGGMCVWNMLLFHPDMIKKALSVTGEYSDYSRLTVNDFSPLKNKSIWLVHADDDNVVSPQCDITCYPMIKDICTDTIFTRYSSGGHHISKKFYNTHEHIRWLTE